MRSSSFMDMSAKMTAMKLIPFSAKHHPAPSQASVKPASDGPMILAVLKIVELRVIAFMRFSLSTISITNDCLAGMSIALTHPSRKDKTMICHGWIVLKNTSNARVNARIIDATWVYMITLRLGSLSRRTPAQRDTRNIGIDEAKLTYPRYTFEFVMSYMSQLWATFCIHVPISDTSCPKKKSL